MFYWLSTRAKYEVAMSYESNFMDKVKCLPRHTDMIITRCPEFHSDTQKHYICVDRNTSKKSNHYIIYFIVKGKTYIQNGNLVNAILHYTDKTYNWPFFQEIWK